MVICYWARGKLLDLFLILINWKFFVIFTTSLSDFSDGICFFQSYNHRCESSDML